VRTKEERRGKCRTEGNSNDGKENQRMNAKKEREREEKK
jgi:hypothetical protein